MAPIHSALRVSAPLRLWMSNLIAEVATSLPEGRPLPEPIWYRRHVVILALLWIHAAVIFAAAVLLGHGIVHATIEGMVPATVAILASEKHGSRRLRATAASVGLASTSALLVHLSQGNIEMHFHFFVVVIIITLYQDWIPFLFAIGFVVFHHGFVGVLDPTAVYNHQDAWDHPWKWAAIHGGFVLAASVAGIVNWRLNEGARATTDLILTAAGEGIYVLDGAGNVEFANPASGALLRQDIPLILGQPERLLVDEGEGALPGAAVIAGTSERHVGRTIVRRGDGTTFLADFVATPMRQRGRASGAVVTFNDVTERLEAEEALRTSEARFRRLFESNPQPMWVYDNSTLAFIEVNDAAVAQYGYDRSEFARMQVSDVVAPEDVAYFSADEALTSAGGRIAAESRHRRKSGEVFAVALTSHRIQFTGRQAVLVVAQDISERVRFQEQLTHQALHDPLTGLPNRTLFTDRLEHALLSGYGSGLPVAVLFLDLDGFKVINDSLGHTVGDELLVAVCKRLARCLAPEDTIARFGGDEFVVLLPDVADVAGAIAVADRLLGELHAPVRVSDRDVFVSASLGLATHTGGGSPLDAHDLLRKADIAMYRAKANGKAQTVTFEDGMDPSALGRLDLETDLRRAIDRSEWELVYQPEHDLRTGALVGMEALVRWHHPDRGIVSPADFIPLAEETGTITALGNWVLREACRQTMEWRSRMPPAEVLVIGVNVSAVQLTQPNFVAEVKAAIDEAGLPATSLRLEITESTAMRDPGRTVEVLQQLRALGVEVAIDDFGTGYSSLSYLSTLPVDVLKIDHAFVRALGEDTNGTAIVNAIVAVAHTLGMRVTAEGIETPAQLGLISHLGCDRGQGYYFARPLAADQFERAIGVPVALGINAVA